MDMQPVTTTDSIEPYPSGSHNTSHEFLMDVSKGLMRKQKSIPCKYLYDQVGSQIFGKICELPEYYLTRCETEILQQHSPFLSTLFKDFVQIIEFGSGDCRKTRLILEAFTSQRERCGYIPIDVSESVLSETTQRLSGLFPNLEVMGLNVTYQEAFSYFPEFEGKPKLFLFLGSNIGNFERHDAVLFLRSIRNHMQANDRIVVGIDLRKNRDILIRAYDDSQGVTAQFNLNVLERINRDLGGSFELRQFAHYVTYNEATGKLEMFLKSQNKQSVWIEALSGEAFFETGELVHTETVVKYSLDEIAALALDSGLHVEHQWFDACKRFSVNVLKLK